MSKARCFNCYVGLPIGKPLEELIESRLPIFCCTECSLKFPDNETDEFEEKLKYMDKFVEVEKIGLERLKEGSIKMKFEPLKNKIHNDFSCECKLLETEHFSKNDIKSAVCWLKFYLKQRKKGCDSIKIKSLLIIINESFEDVI